MNRYLNRVTGIVDVKELMAGIMKSGVKMEDPSEVIITVNGGHLLCLCISTPTFYSVDSYHSHEAVVVTYTDYEISGNTK